jgi:hypothetical protein
MHLGLHVKGDAMHKAVAILLHIYAYNKPLVVEAGGEKHIG